MNIDEGQMEEATTYIGIHNNKTKQNYGTISCVGRYYGSLTKIRRPNILLN